ncbi:hypothetical protein JYU34_005871 [Plutella xylostella]|uniref:Alanine--glyoxylate aminotransferase n=1 Tax=Plutella xylostella TaxID=51655 RepID=A0ABQ7QUC5_PLUXY|nr:hypothetical protein JYU34_005871 [Plutella xylostella]
MTNILLSRFSYNECNISEVGKGTLEYIRSHLKHLLPTMSGNSLTVSPARIEDREFKQPLLCGPGPANYWPAMNDALTKWVISPMDDEYFWVLQDIRAGLQYAFQTSSPLVLAISGAGHSGMETVISNLLGRGEKLLIASRGIWDERACSMATRYGITPIVHSTAMTSTFSLSELEEQLKVHRPAALFITHGDSSTGSVQHLPGLGDLCHQYGALLIVDTVVSLVAVPFEMDRWGVDAVYTSLQKGLSGPAGITPVAFSARAEEKIKNRKHEPPFYFDMKLLAQQWNCYGDTRSYHHTLSPPLLWALRCSLQELCREGLEQSWARHAAATARFHQRLQTMPVTFLIPKPEDRLATVTTVVIPKEYDQLAVLKHIRDKYNIVIFRGLGPTVGVALRIGLMGVNATLQVADQVADALEDALITLKKGKL